VILTLDSKRRLTIPAALAAASGGDAFQAVYDEKADKIVLRRVKRAKQSWLEVMKKCPVSMDDLRPRSRRYYKRKQRL
jgi:bifunctional DNA-binding transcriptional regulator/antitoxin component of YhaV-PrlF toxin-antitoxin module